MDPELKEFLKTHGYEEISDSTETIHKIRHLVYRKGEESKPATTTIHVSFIDK